MEIVTPRGRAAVLLALAHAFLLARAMLYCVQDEARAMFAEELQEIAQQVEGFGSHLPFFCRLWLGTSGGAQYREDCWMAIDGKVYNITSYFAQHPTPPSVLLPWCGKEATEGMRTKGYGSNHSPAAWEHLPQLQVGVLAGEPY